MRVDGTLNWILSDHLGSTSVTAHADGSWRGEIAYAPFGETRSSLGTTPTDYRFTGQRLEVELGLYFYQARWYDPALGVFTQADTIIPNPSNPLDMNRYSYVRFNPLKYTDPSGHVCFYVGGRQICSDDNDWSVIYTSSDSSGNDTTTPSSGWAWGLSRKQWGESYISQGYGTNDCGTSNLAMLFNAITGGGWEKTDFLPWRLGPPFPKNTHGATPPWEFAYEFNKQARSQEIHMKADYISHGTKEIVLHELESGNPVSVIKIWKGGGAHWVTIVAYDEPSDTVFYMDPNPVIGAEENVAVNKVQEQSWGDFENAWSQQVWWTRRLDMKNEMIVYSENPWPREIPEP